MGHRLDTLSIPDNGPSVKTGWSRKPSSRLMIGVGASLLTLAGCGTSSETAATPGKAGTDENVEAMANAAENYTPIPTEGLGKAELPEGKRPVDIMPARYVEASGPGAFANHLLPLEGHKTDRILCWVGSAIFRVPLDDGESIAAVRVDNPILIPDTSDNLHVIGHLEDGPAVEGTSQKQDGYFKVSIGEVDFRKRMTIDHESFPDIEFYPHTDAKNSGQFADCMVTKVGSGGTKLKNTTEVALNRGNQTDLVSTATIFLDYDDPALTSGLGTRITVEAAGPFKGFADKHMADKTEAENLVDSRSTAKK